MMVRALVLSPWGERDNYKIPQLLIDYPATVSGEYSKDVTLTNKNFIIPEPSSVVLEVVRADATIALISNNQAYHVLSEVSI